MDETGNCEPQTPVPEGDSAPSAPTQKGIDAPPDATKRDRIDQQDFANPTLNIIQSFSRTTSVSSQPSREATPPPLPPRPQLGIPSSRPSTAHSIAATRPQLLSKATTQLSYATSQAYGGESRDDLSADTAPKQRGFLDVNTTSHSASEADDSASVRSYVPPTEAGGYAESILGEVMAQQEKSEQEKLLLSTLGHRFVDTEAQSMFPPDPWLESAFEREFDEIDDMKTDGSNEGQEHDTSLQLAIADVVDRGRYATMASKIETFPHSFKCWQAYLQPTWR